MNIIDELKAMESACKADGCPDEAKLMRQAIAIIEAADALRRTAKNACDTLPIMPGLETQIGRYDAARLRLLESENAILRKAVGHYADREIWMAEYVNKPEKIYIPAEDGWTVAEQAQRDVENLTKNSKKDLTSEQSA